MVKCNEIRDPKGSIWNVYKCPYCEFMSKSQQSCERHVYKEHRELAHQETQNELDRLKK